MHDYLALYLATLGSAKGRASMLRLLNRLPEFNGGNGVDWTLITASQVVTMLSSMEHKGLSVATLNMTLSGIKGVCHAAWREQALSDECYARIKDLKQKKSQKLPAGRAILHGEIQMLFDACAQDKNITKGIRDAAILALGLYVGLRRSEISLLKAKHVNLENMTLQVLGKGNKEEILPLPDIIKPYLIAWLDLRTSAMIERHLTGQHLFGRIIKSGRIFALDGMNDHSVYFVLKERALEAGIDIDSLPTPHDMRRTKATNLLDSDVNPRIVQKLMRHANVETTMRYDRGNIEDAMRNATNLN